MTTISKSCIICEVEFTPRTSRQKTCGSLPCKKKNNSINSVRWGKENPERRKAAIKKHRLSNGYKAHEWPAKRANGLLVSDLKKKTPCVDCNQIFPEECMDFDHVRGEKIGNVGTMVSHGWSKESILEEIAKCEIVCANCHRTRTKKRRLGLL